MSILILFIPILFMFPLFRFTICNLHKIIIGTIKDLYKYIKYKRWNECNEYGKIHCYTGLFGQGKTKECVRHITSIYKKYNGKMIYDEKEKKYIQQKINIYSNVQLTIPYINLTSLQQLVDCQATEKGTVNLFLIDEASVVFNSREFKNNFSTPSLNTILCSRHFKIGIYMTSQRFSHCDALLRQVTSHVYECRYYKPLRIQQIKKYDAWEIENCSNIRLIKPLQTLYTYSSDKVYALYDTYAMVKDITKKVKECDFIEDDKVLAKQQGTESQIPLYVSNPKRKLKKRF